MKKAWKIRVKVGFERGNLMIIDYLRKTYGKTNKDFYSLADDALQKGEKMFIVTANPEIFMNGEKDEDFGQILMRKDVVIVPDGIGVVKAMEMAKISVKERIPGVELAAHLIKTAGECEKSVFFLGAKQFVIDALVEKVKKENPKIRIAGAVNGYDRNKDEVFGEILEKKPDLVFVALGVPAQEKLIAKYYDRFEKGIFIGVGGSFDVLSGTKSRAPKFFIKMNLEWLYRIMKEPKRIGRFYKSNVKFFSVVKKQIKEGK